MQTLMHASQQWAKRPDDERFNSVKEMYEAAHAQMMASQAIKVPNDNPVKVGYDNLDETMLLDVHEAGSFALNNWTFGQLCSKIQAPSDYLVGLDDPELVADCLNRGLRNQQRDPGRKSSGIQLYHQNSTLRALTSNRYSRIYDCEILERLMLLRDEGWKTPPAWARDKSSPLARQATEEDVLNYSLVNLGDWIEPSGLYRGDRDMFCFLVNDESRIDDGTEDGLGRGFFVRNSEVGYTSFSFMDFLYRYVCGNHIVWGVQDVREIRLRHIGADTPEKAFEMLSAELIEYANMSAEEDELLIANAKKCILGDDKSEVLDFLFSKKRLMSKKLAEESYDTCEQYEPSLNPRSAWGIIQGLTRASQDAGFADKRNRIDSLTPRILALVA